mgnify:CR=1 FL=1
MCISTAIHFRIDKIACACADPYGGSSVYGLSDGWHKDNWPAVEHAVKYERDAARLLLVFSQNRPVWRERFRSLAEKFPDLVPWP